MLWTMPATTDTQRILGIDPGLRLTGFGVVALRDGQLEPTLVEAGVIKLNSKWSMQQRLLQLHEEMSQLIADTKPTRMAVEKLYAHYNHPRTAILMAHARGVIMLCAKQAGLPVVDLPSTEVKKSVTGYGHASKQQMQEAVRTQLHLAQPPSPPDVADALAIALTHARRIAVDRLG